MGQFPFWNPYVFSGFPAFGDFQTAVLYPPYAVLRLLTLEQFLLWNVALHLWIAGIGTYLLARQLGASRLAATTAGIAFALGGALTPRILGGMLHFVCGLAWLPWAVVFAIRSARRGSLAPHPGLVVILAMQYLTGYVQIFVYTIAAAVFCYLWLAVTERGPTRRIPRQLVTAIFSVIVALAFVIGLLSVQLASAARLLPEMGRTAGIEYEAAARWAPQPRDVLTILFPRAFAVAGKDFSDDSGAILWEKADYVGLMLPVLALAGLALGWKRNEVRMLAVLALLTYLFAMANTLPLFRLHYLLLGGFRYPGRLLPVLSMALATLGALGLDAVQARARNTARQARHVPASAVVLGAGLVGIGCVRADGSSGALLGTPAWMVLVSIIGLIAVPLLARRSRWTAASGMLALLVVSADVVSFAQAFVTVQKPPRLDEVASTLAKDNVGRVLSACEEGFSLYRPMNVLVPMVDGLNTAFFLDYAKFASIVRDGRVPTSLRQFPTVFLETPRRLDLLDLMNVTHVVKCTPLNVDGFQLVGQVDGLYIYRNRSPLPRAQWLCAADVVENEQQVIELLSDSRRDPRQRVAVKRSPEQIDEASLVGCQNTASVETTVRDTPGGALSVNVQSSGPGMLVLSEPYYSERRAWIDGVATPLLRANLAFSAVLVPGGAHRVDLDFSPDRLYLGIALSLITAALIAGLELRRRHSHLTTRAP
jgi:hypothetical protein